jgi:hypothetical protein
VQAFVVNIKHAAAPDVEGIINPLLLRYQTGGCHYGVFGLPAVQVRSVFKVYYMKCIFMLYNTVILWQTRQLDSYCAIRQAAATTASLAFQLSRCGARLNAVISHACSCFITCG